MKSEIESFNGAWLDVASFVALDDAALHQVIGGVGTDTGCPKLVNCPGYLCDVHCGVRYPLVDVAL